MRNEKGETVYTLFYHYPAGADPFYGVFSTLRKAQAHAPAVWLGPEDYKTLGATFDEYFYIKRSLIDAMPVASGGGWDFWEAIGLSTNDSLPRGHVLRAIAARILDPSAP